MPVNAPPTDAKDPDAALPEAVPEEEDLPSIDDAPVPPLTAPGDTEGG